MSKHNSMLFKIVFSLFLFFVSNASFAQTIFKGSIEDFKTGEPVGYATVFLANTTFGTTSDEEGKFSLTLPEGNYEVIIRMLGYQSLTFKLPTAIVKPREYRFRLVAVDEELETLNVNDTRDPAWYKNLKDFKSYFLGTTFNGQTCELENELSIVLDDQSEPGTLIASSREILEIHNPNLGYRLDYLLNDFRYNYKEGFVTYGGYPLFIPDTTLSTRRQKRVEKNRLEAFQGSLQHFLRSVYAGTTVSEGFEIRRLYRRDDPIHPGEYIDSVGTELITSSAFRKNRETREFLEFTGHLQITYLNERESPQYTMGMRRTMRNTQTSIMTLMAESLEIFENGSLSDPFGLLMEGYIGWERVGDLLPIDYSPPKEVDREVQ